MKYRITRALEALENGTFCAMCKGSGRMSDMSFSKPRRDIERDCRYCHGKGKVAVSTAELRLRMLSVAKYAYYAVCGPDDQFCGEYPEMEQLHGELVKLADEVLGPA